MDKKKIGGVIVSDYNHTNYGSALQAYATKISIQKMGCDLFFIKYKKKRSIFELFKIIPFYLLSGGFDRIKRYFINSLIKVFIPSYEKNQKIRIFATNAFKEQEFSSYFREYKGYQELRAGSKEYDVIFVGSDQTWRPIGFYSNYWNLNFVDINIPKFSYAASFGVSKIPSFQTKGTKEYLERIDLISVREKKAKEIVESVSNKKAEVVADPTLLLDFEQWKMFANHSSKRIDGPYIFCYFLGPRKDIREQVKLLAKQKKCKIVAIPHMEQYRTADRNFGDYMFYDFSPYDFVKILFNAAYVCTDSFHGTVFSIIAHKQFVTFYREFGESTNSRIDSLLSILGLSEQVFKNDINIIDNIIDYVKVEENLSNYRLQSLSFLRKACNLA